MFDMVKSAACSGIVKYSRDTTRTITDIDIASKQSADVILGSGNTKKNIADSRCSLTMEVLAEAVSRFFGGKCELVPMLQDEYI